MFIRPGFITVLYLLRIQARLNVGTMSVQLQVIMTWCTVEQWRISVRKLKNNRQKKLTMDIVVDSNPKLDK